LCTFSLFFKAAVARSGGDSGGDAPSFNMERLAQKHHKTVQRVRAIQLLAPRTLRRHFQDSILVDSRRKFRMYPLALVWMQSCRMLDIEEQRHPRRDFIDVLASRTSATRCYEEEFLFRNLKTLNDTNHGTILAHSSLGEQMRGIRYGFTFLASFAVGAGFFVTAIGLIMALTTAMQTTSANAGVQVGKPAPDIVVRDLDGRLVRLSDLRGKPAVLVFWADWCPDCKAAIPDFNKLHQQGVQVLGVNLMEDSTRVAKAVEAGPIQYRVALDPNGNAGRVYGVNAIPNVFVVDAHGVIVQHRYDAPTVKDVKD
jgi:peroxiredoxin